MSLKYHYTFADSSLTYSKKKKVESRSPNLLNSHIHPGVKSPPWSFFGRQTQQNWRLIYVRQISREFDRWCRGGRVVRNFHRRRARVANCGNEKRNKAVVSDDVSKKCKKFHFSCGHRNKKPYYPFISRDGARSRAEKTCHLSSDE